MSTPVFHNKGSKPNLQMWRHSLYSCARERTKSGSRALEWKVGGGGKFSYKTRWNIKKNKKRLWTRREEAREKKKKAAAGVAVAALKGSSVDLVCSRGGQKSCGSAEKPATAIQRSREGKRRSPLAGHPYVLLFCLVPWMPTLSASQVLTCAASILFAPLWCAEYFHCCVLQFHVLLLRREAELGV